MQRRLLITGGTGYLGTELVRQALKAGWDVAATSFSRRFSADAARYLYLDVRDQRAVEQAFDALRPAAVVHTAYRQAGPDLWTTTAEAPALVARAARRVGARLIHISSDAIFDGERTGSYTEQDQPAPITPYGQAKAAAERMVAECYPAALIARTSLIYGGATLSKHEQLVLDAADGQVEVGFFTDELRCPVAVGDLAAALLELLVRDRSGLIHLAGADVVSRYAFAQLVARAHGRSLDQLHAAESSVQAVRRARNCALDCRLAQNLLQTRLRGVHEVLR
jgi:dTDP-4-dehydrorhamnose reductase